jgi:hypothetical protein
LWCAECMAVLWLRSQLLQRGTFGWWLSGRNVLLLA